MNLFENMSDKELRTVYDEYRQYHDRGVIGGNTLRNIRELYVGEYGMPGVTIMSMQLLESIADRWASDQDKTSEDVPEKSLVQEAHALETVPVRVETGSLFVTAEYYRDKTLDFLIGRLRNTDDEKERTACRGLITIRLHFLENTRKAEAA